MVMKWTTFDGREADTATATHQHLSNYIWYFVGLLGYPISYAKDHIEAIKVRFTGKILPYRPYIGFLSELNMLIDKGLVYTNEQRQALIIYQKKVIGEILPHTHPLFSHLKT